MDLGRVQAMLNQPAEAMATLAKAAEIAKPQQAAEAARLAGDLAYQQEQWDKAITFYNVVLTRHTSSSHLTAAITGKLWSQFQAKQYGQVLETFEQYAKHMEGQDRVTGWYLAGASQQELGQHDKSIALFSAILAAAAGSPLEDKVLYRLAASQFEIGQYDGMMQTIAKLRRSYPNSPRLADAGFLMASAAVKQNDPTTAAARLTAIVEAGASHPYFTQSLLQRARLYESNKQYEPAIADYQRYVDVFDQTDNQIKLGRQTYQQALLQLVGLNYLVGRYEAAGQAAARLLTEKDLNPLIEAEALYRQALAQIKLKSYEQGHETLSLLLRKFPQNAFRSEALYYRGLLLLALKKPDESSVDLQAAAATADLAPALKANALRLVAIRQRERDEADAAAKTLTVLEDLVGPTGMSLDEQLWMGRHQLKVGKPQESLRQLKPILEGRVRASKPQRTEALLLAADALRQLKDLKAAMQAYREVIAMGHGMGLQARLELARTMVAAEELEGAIDEFKGLYTADETATAAAALFDAAQVHRRLAQQRLRESNTQGAQEQLEAARANLKRLVLLYAFPELSPLPELSYIDLGNLALERGDGEAAKAEWNELLEKFPEGPYATYAKAMLAARNDQRQVAMGLLTELRGRQLDARLMERVNERIKALESRS